MIVKKIKLSKARAGAKAKAAHIRDLTSYIAAPDKTEKLLYLTTRGFLCQEFVAQQAEMIALAAEAVRSATPVTHWILSWREGERPTTAQIDQAVDLFISELGLTGHQIVAGAHQDTDNLHVHIAVNRVHPDSLKVVKPNRGFDLEAAHRALAKIERTQGWQPEAGARYSFLPDGSIWRTEKADRTQTPDSRAQDMEIRTGEKSAQRIAQEQASKLIAQARSWDEAHMRLAAAGIRYIKKGSGGLILVGDVAVKASCARHCSLPALQKRFGPFEPANRSLAILKRTREPTEAAKTRQQQWPAYTEARMADKASRDAARTKIRVRHTIERQLLLSEHRRIRAEVLRGSWRSRGAERNAAISVLAARKARALADLQDRLRQEREATRIRRFPCFEEWLSGQNGPEAATAWRYRCADSFNHVSGVRYEVPRPRDIRDFIPAVSGRTVHYASSLTGELAFVDRGREISVLKIDYASTLATLQLAASKWGCPQVHGSKAFKDLCVRVAAEQGIHLANKDLQTEADALRAGTVQRVMELIHKRNDSTPKNAPKNPSIAEAREQWKEQKIKIETSKPPEARQVQASSPSSGPSLA